MAITCFHVLLFPLNSHIQNTHQNLLYSGMRWERQEREGEREAKPELFNLTYMKTKSSSGCSEVRHTVNVLFTCSSAGALTALMLQQSSLMEKGSALPLRAGCASTWCCAWLILVCVRVCERDQECEKIPHLLQYVCFCESKWEKSYNKGKKGWNNRRQRSSRRSLGLLSQTWKTTWSCVVKSELLQVSVQHLDSVGGHICNAVFSCYCYSWGNVMSQSLDGN